MEFKVISCMLDKFFRFLFPAKHSVEIKRKYNIPDVLNLRIELTKDGWFVADCPELPGLFTQARSKEELLTMFNDAVLTYFDVPRREADIVYDELTFGGEVIRYNAKLQTA